MSEGVNKWMSEWLSEWVSEWEREWVSEWVSEWVTWWISELFREIYEIPHPQPLYFEELHFKKWSLGRILPEEGAYVEIKLLSFPQLWEDMQMGGYTGLKENSKQIMES